MHFVIASSLVFSRLGVRCERRVHCSNVRRVPLLLFVGETEQNMDMAER
jgi:hypothetical protein